MIRRIRLFSGLVMLAYVAMHLLNHAAGLVSVEAMGWALARAGMVAAADADGALQRLSGALRARFGRCGSARACGWAAANTSSSCSAS